VKSVRVSRLASPLAMALALSFTVPALGEGFAPVRLTPSEIQLKSDTSRPGSMDMAVLAGDMSKPGLYATRIRIPAQLRIPPHAHPEDRVVVVLAGTLHFGFGDRFDPAAMKAMTPGSFFIEPAGKPHFAWTQSDDAILQVSGIGPSGTVYLNPADAAH
jgi:quercetin dioxygenase-like cupin family protein